MATRRGNTRIEWYDTDILLWGSIVPPTTEDKTLKPWLWDIWGTGPRGQQQQGHLDIGASGHYVRQLWVTQMFCQENYTSGTTSGLHGGFHTQVSGLYPESGFNLATKAYVDFAIASIPSGAVSLSGLIDVSGIWTSGMAVVFDGNYFVPGIAVGGSGSSFTEGSGLYDAGGITHVGNGWGIIVSDSGVSVKTTDLDARYALSGSGSGGTPYTAGSGIDLTGFEFNISAGWGLVATTSGLYVNRSDLAVFFQASGLYEVSGTGYTKAESDARYQASGFPAEGSGLYQSGIYYHVGAGWGITVSNSGINVKTSDLDVRYALSGSSGSTGATSFSGLSDVSGIWTSGQEVAYDGTHFVPTIDAGASPTLTIITSGQVMVEVLISGGILPVSAASFDISGIPATYDDLIFRMQARGTRTGSTSDSCNVFFNADTTVTNYQTLGDYSQAPSTTSAYSVNSSLCLFFPSFDAPASGYWGMAEVVIPNYTTSNKKVAAFKSDDRRDTVTNNLTIEGFFAWDNVAIINRILLTANTSGFLAGTRYQLIGRKSQWVITSGSYGNANIANGLFVP